LNALIKVSYIVYVFLYNFSPSKKKKVAAFHGLGQLATVTSMSLGSVSFVNVVKALEPVFTAAITLLVLGKNMPWQVCVE
jgi:drug/metabolite transporter (DMT)-like permease